MSVSAPREENEEVAVAPKYSLLYTENLYEEAFPNCCRAVKVFATVASILSLFKFVKLLFMVVREEESVSLPAMVVIVAPRVCSFGADSKSESGRY